MKLKEITTMGDEKAAEIGVRRFARAMRAKLAAKRREGRRGWNHPDEVSEGALWEMMVDHVKKGDPVDVANFAMMVWNRRNPRG